MFYLTNVLDPAKLSMQDVARLYARRWDIELAFKVLKRELGLCLWWGARPEIVMIQLWLALILAQVLHALQLQVALLAEVEPFDVSMHVLIEIIPLSDEPFLSLLRRMLDDGRMLGLIRPHQRIIPEVPAVPALRPDVMPAKEGRTRRGRYAGRNPHPRTEVYTSVFCTQWLL